MPKGFEWTLATAVSVIFLVLLISIILVFVIPKFIKCRCLTQGRTNVFGGQKLRLAIARAVCREPEIYVFDVLFSALDYKTDRALRSALPTSMSLRPAKQSRTHHFVTTLPKGDDTLLNDKANLSQGS